MDARPVLDGRELLRERAAARGLALAGVAPRRARPIRDDSPRRRATPRRAAEQAPPTWWSGDPRRRRTALAAALLFVGGHARLVRRDLAGLDRGLVRLRRLGALVGQRRLDRDEEAHAFRGSEDSVEPAELDDVRGRLLHEVGAGHVPVERPHAPEGHERRVRVDRVGFREVVRQVARPVDVGDDGRHEALALELQQPLALDVRVDAARRLRAPIHALREARLRDERPQERRAAVRGARDEDHRVPRDLRLDGRRVRPPPAIDVDGRRRRDGPAGLVGRARLPGAFPPLPAFVRARVALQAVLLAKVPDVAFRRHAARP